MATVTATKARNDPYRLVDHVRETHEPIEITGKRGNAVLVGEDDWRAIQETLFLVSIPGMRESILEGMEHPWKDSRMSPAGELEARLHQGGTEGRAATRRRTHRHHLRSTFTRPARASGAGRAR